MHSWRLRAALVLSLTVTTAASAETIRVGIPERGNIQYLTLWVALGAGYLQAEGLDDVQVVFAPASNQSGQLLLQRQADVALLQPPVYLGLIAQRQPIVLFANLLGNDPINLVVRPDVAARLKLDPRAPLADRLKAMKGLRIGVASEPPRRLRVLFAQAGMDADKDVVITIIRGDEQIAAYKAGTVDALYTHTPFLEDALTDLGAVLMVNQSGGEVGALSGGQIHSMATTREFADTHPDVVHAVTRAIARAQQLLHTDADAAAQALVKAGITVPSPRHLATIVGIYRAAVPATPHVSASAVERNATLYPARPAMPDFSQVRAADFLAPAFAEALSKPKDVSHLGVIEVSVTAPIARLSPVTDTLDRIAITDRQALTVDQAIEDLPGGASRDEEPVRSGLLLLGRVSRARPKRLRHATVHVPHAPVAIPNTPRRIGNHIQCFS